MGLIIRSGEMKRLTLFFVIIICLFSLTSCKKCVSTEYITADVKIVDEHSRRDPKTGKVYRITVEYEGEKYSVGYKETYEKYHESVGSQAKGMFWVKTYDDGSKKYYFDDLE